MCGRDRPTTPISTAYSSDDSERRPGERRAHAHRSGVEPGLERAHRPTRFQLTTGFGLLADVGAVVLLWRGREPSVVNHPRESAGGRCSSVAVLTPVLVLTAVVDQVKQTISGGATLPSMDAGTWIHAHAQDGGDFTLCTTAFTVEAGPARGMVTACSRLTLQ